MLRNKKVACLVFLSALFMGGGGLLVGKAYAKNPIVVPEGWDPAFYECVKSTFGEEDVDDDGPTDGQLAIIRELICEDMGIEKVDQLAKMTSLTTLSLGKNNITSIDLSKNVDLEDLNLKDNKLTFVDISKNTSLERFDVDDIYVKAAISHEKVGDKVIFHFSDLLFLNYYVYPKSVDHVMQYSVSDGNLVVSELGQTNGYVQIVKVASMDPTTGAIEENYFKVLLLARVLFLDLNDGSGRTETLVCGLDAVDDGSCLVTLPEGPSREGYVFKGWAVGSEEDDLAQPGEKIKLEDEETKITAVWGEESEENEDEDEDEDEIGVPDTGYNTNSDNNNTAFVILALPIMILIVGIVAYIRDLKKSHVKFD